MFSFLPDSGYIFCHFNFVFLSLPTLYSYFRPVVFYADVSAAAG